MLYKKYTEEGHRRHVTHHPPTQTQTTATTMTNNMPSQSPTSLTHTTNLASHTSPSPPQSNSLNHFSTNPGRHQNSTSSNISSGQAAASTGHHPLAARPPPRASRPQYPRTPTQPLLSSALPRSMLSPRLSSSESQSWTTIAIPALYST